MNKPGRRGGGRRPGLMDSESGGAKVTIRRQEPPSAGLVPALFDFLDLSPLSTDGARMGATKNAPEAMGLQGRPSHLRRDCSARDSVRHRAPVRDGDQIPPGTQIGQAAKRVIPTFHRFQSRSGTASVRHSASAIPRRCRQAMRAIAASATKPIRLPAPTSVG